MVRKFRYKYILFYFIFTPLFSIRVLKSINKLYNKIFLIQFNFLYTQYIKNTIIKFRYYQFFFYNSIFENSVYFFQNF